MTASDTSVGACNQALLQIGARATIASLDEGSVEANACSILYTPTFEMLGRSAPWNCLRKQITMTLVAAAQGTPENPDGTTLPLPPTPWLYAYAEPSDCLQVRFIVPSFPNQVGGTPLTTASFTAGACFPGDGAIPFVVAYSTDASNNPTQVILCNQTQAQVVYTVAQPNPVIWDSMFRQGFVSSLSAFLVPALSLNLALMQASIKVADSIIMQARIRDGDEGITVVDHIPDWMRARNSGGAVNGYGGYAPWLYANYQGMSWPG